MIPFLTAGLAMGISAGFSPGPLLALVVSQTITYGFKEGAKVAFAPLLTDFPILFLSTLLLIRLSSYNVILGVISILGGIFLTYLAYQSLKTKGVEITPDRSEPRSFVKGIIVNALNPHPYLFWLTAGGTIILKGLAEGLAPAVVFVVTFLGSMVGSKILLALIVGQSRHFLAGRAYLLVMRILGFALFLFALILFKDGFHLLK